MDKNVTLSDLHTVSLPVEPSRASSRAASDEQRDRASADTLVAHWPVRVAIAILGGGMQLGVMLAHPGRGDTPALLAVVAGYLLVAGVMTAFVRRRALARPIVVTLALAWDLAFVFAATAASSATAYYDRSLFCVMVIVHVANFYFGRRQSTRVLAIAFAGYVLLLAWARGRHLPVDVLEELWTMCVALVGTALIAAQAGHIRTRLRTIVTLFERAEQGDFTHKYDEAADRRHDAITRVGLAYNRVRTQLASMVLSDPLTGCLNRRGFEQALAREISRASRAGSELALLVLDLDHFKLVNDTYGHPAGDEVLRAAGRLLLQTARVGDIVARVGGEEFAILLPATGADGALRFATRLCDLVRAQPFPVSTQGAAIRVTTSIGVAAVAPRNSRDSGSEGAVLAHHADVALYAAKRSGRDQAREWGPQLETLPRAAGAPPMDDVLPLGLA